VSEVSSSAGVLPAAGMPHRHVLGMRVDAPRGYGDAVDLISGWAGERVARAVGVATVNNVMESYDDPSFREVMNGCDLVTPDGMPLVWGLSMLGVRAATRVCGPELTPLLLARAAERGIPVGFYGGDPATIEALVRVATVRWPQLQVAYAVSPPFRALSDAEDAAVVDEILTAGVQLLFIGLGCPKQERWMAEHRERLPLVSIGVGAAFDFLAGSKRQAPRLLQRIGLEWAFRLVSEPRRLWKRYLRQNPRFVMLFGRQLVRERRSAQR
jgi:N-acetylglucosaminyldiphosphoundecaprenol N-acetyl-beta-D-mannosaminyltransferase